MGWEQTIDESGWVRWERTDGYATISLRETASNEWAVWIDRLEQAADGPGYEHAVFDSEAAAQNQATAWREQFDREE
ncbi:MAG: hypothetical protein ABEI76_07140 [Halobacteriales archaeon]